MNDDLRTRLSALATLSISNRENRPCKICGSVADIFDVVDFHKSCSWPIYKFGISGIPVYYYRCLNCRFLFSDFLDDWTGEEISKFIYNEDYIEVDPEYTGDRARRDADMFADMLSSFKQLSILDYGSGTGVLAACLRDAGYDAESYDPYSSPHLPTRRFDFISCMEVIEHSPDPVATMREMKNLLNKDGCIFIGTQLQPDDIEQERAHWWYIGPRNGHVSIQSKASIVTLGRTSGLTCYPSGNLHGFASSPSKASVELLKMVGRPTLNIVLSAPAEPVSADATPKSDPSEWHYIEDGSFRWTADRAVSWRWSPAVSDCDVNIRIPCIMEIESGFMSQSKLIVQDRVIPAKVEGQELIASASITGQGPVTLRLETPPLPSPFELRGFPDMRRLGLAIRVIESCAVSS